MRTLFWNINKRPLIDEVGELAKQENLDVLVLAECNYSHTDIINKLNSTTGGNWNKCNDNIRVKTFARLDLKYIDNYKNDYDGPSWTVVRLKAPLQREVTIVGVHFPSKLHWDDLSQSFECINLINKIRKYEVDKILKNTILIGDFNMNPFEPGMIASVGIHGVKDKKIALKNFRSIQTTDYDFFYNPMWNFLGDRQPPAGTYYYPKSIHLSHFWNTYDQILFRPQLMRDYEESSLKIVQHIGKKNLLNGRGKPSKTYSDHLPIFVSFNLIK